MPFGKIRKDRIKVYEERRSSLLFTFLDISTARKQADIRSCKFIDFMTCERTHKW